MAMAGSSQVTFVKWIFEWMEKESINGGAKRAAACPVMEIAFRKGRSCFFGTGAKRQGEYGCVCVCVWVVGFMCEVER